MMRFWNSASVAAHAMLKRISQNDEVTKVFQVYFSAGFLLQVNASGYSLPVLL